jgi:hypothetical protein
MVKSWSNGSLVRGCPMTAARCARLQVSAVLLATASYADTPCALQLLAGRPVAAYALDVAVTTPRLRQPRLQCPCSVVVAAAPTAAPALARWAGQAGLPPDSVCAATPHAGAAGGRCSLGSALAAAAPSLHGSSHVLLLDASAVLEPGGHARRAHGGGGSRARRSGCRLSSGAPRHPP